MSKRKRSKRRVCLDESVSVVPIPMRSEYSDRVKERLWSSATELYQNAARNSIEFAAEGWNWRTVTEDEKMLVCTVSGELIHPIHLHNALQLNVCGGEGENPTAPSAPGVVDASTGQESTSLVPECPCPKQGPCP